MNDEQKEIEVANAKYGPIFVRAEENLVFVMQDDDEPEDRHSVLVHYTVIDELIAALQKARDQAEAWAAAYTILDWKAGGYPTAPVSTFVGSKWVKVGSFGTWPLYAKAQDPMVEP